MQVKQQQLEPEMEQWTVSKLGKEYLPGTLVIFIHQSIFSHKYLLNLTLCFLVGSENTLESKTPMLDSSFP